MDLTLVVGPCIIIISRKCNRRGQRENEGGEIERKAVKSAQGTPPLNGMGCIVAGSYQFAQYIKAFYECKRNLTRKRGFSSVKKEEDEMKRR